MSCAINENGLNHAGPTTLEFLDEIPIVSTVTGAVRQIFGAAEVLLGIPAFPIQLIGRAYGIKHSFLIVQGLANIVRGHVAMYPITGNIAIYLYDHSSIVKNDFRRSAGIIV